ncbi:unnamed protein product [Ascophyllum nodosum]
MNFSKIGIQGYSLGSLHLNSEEFVWTSADKSSSKKLKWADVSHATWAQFGDYCHLRLFMKNDLPPVRLDGFSKSQYSEVEKFLAEQDLELSKDRINCGGGNYGKIDVLGDIVRFSAENRTLFDLNVKDISQCVMPGVKKSNDVELQLHESDATDQTEDTLVAIRVTLPEKDDDMDEPSPAENLQMSVMERANIHDVKGKVLVEFNENQGTFDFPRGRYSIEMYSHFMRMHGTRYDYKIQYNDISKLFLLEKPDERYVAFVVSLDKPIRQGQQKYQHLVLRTTKDEATILVNMSSEDLQNKYNGNLNSEMTGPLHNLVAKIFKVLADKAVYVTGKFSSNNGAKSVKCALGANEGHLYPLNKSFIFIHKPTCIIGFDEIESVEFQRYGGAQGAGVTRNFDLCVAPKSVAGETTKPYVFSGIDRAEYTSLYSFLSTKKLRIKNIKQSGNDGSMLQLGNLDDHDPYKAVLDEDQDEDDEESEDDADYAPGAQGGSDVESSSESEGDDDDSDIVPQEKSKKRSGTSSGSTSGLKKQRVKASGSGSSKAGPGPKKRAKKDKNAPKGASSAYMQFSQAKRAEAKEANPDMKPTEISKVLGEQWGKMDAAAKAPYNERAQADKERYRREKDAYDSKMATGTTAEGSQSRASAGSDDSAEDA